MKCFGAGLLLAVAAIAAGDEAENTAAFHQEVYVKGPAVQLTDAAIDVISSGSDTIIPDGELVIEWGPSPQHRWYGPGTVRGSDVTDENTVESSQVANAVIQLKGRGPLWNNQRRGLITTFMDWSSPF